MARLMIGVSGIRGIYGDGLNESIAERFAFAFGRLYPGTIVIGRDSRKSGRVIADSVISGLNPGGKHRDRSWIRRNTDGRNGL